MNPDGGDKHVELVKTADTVMYRAKGAGKNHYVFTENIIFLADNTDK